MLTGGEKLRSAALIGSEEQRSAALIRGEKQRSRSAALNRGAKHRSAVLIRRGKRRFAMQCMQIGEKNVDCGMSEAMPKSVESRLLARFLLEAVLIMPGR